MRRGRNTNILAKCCVPRCVGAMLVALLATLPVTLSACSFFDEEPPDEPPPNDPVREFVERDGNQRRNTMSVFLNHLS